MSLYKDKIELYKVEFTKEMNAHLENISSYLNDKTPFKTFTLAKRVKPSVTAVVRLPMNGQYDFSDDFNFNYCRITHQSYNEETGATSYNGVDFYFVDDYRWLANNTLEVSLSYDTINSFLSEDLSEVLDSSTMILREHEDRWNGGSLILANNIATLKTALKVDRISEGFASPRLLKSEEYAGDPILDDSFKSDDRATTWAVAYGRESSADKFLRMFIVPMSSSTIKAQVNQHGPDEAVAPTIVTLANAKRFNYYNSFITKIIEYPYFPFADNIIVGDSTSGAYDFYIDGFLLNYIQETAHDPTKDGETITADSIFADGSQEDPACAVRVDYNYLASAPIKGRKLSSVSFPYANVVKSWTNTASLLTMKRTLEDSKLYHSDFFVFRLAYDVFAYEPRYEDLTFGGAGSSPEKFDVNYIVSSHLSNVFAFRFDYNYTASIRDDSDYSNLLLCKRNNELPLVTDSYLNYVLNGYNYDKQSQAISTTSQVVSGLVGAGTALATGHPVIAGITLAVTAFNTINNLISSEVNIASKQNSLAQKGITLAGNEESDIFRWATGGKLNEFVYEVSPELRQMLDSYFYYYGYKRGFQGLPKASSRVWFNFVQAVPKWLHEAPLKWRPLWDDLARKFESGITFYHHNVVDYPGFIEDGYNFKRNLENWERSLLNVNGN